jgi:diguanylate cyclase (GGDEF)-like protein
MLRVLKKLLAVDTQDPDLAQAQFRSCSKQIPLLYIILVSNAAAIMVDFFRADYLFRTLVVPMFVCAFALSRAWWWWNQGNKPERPHAETARLIKRTCNLASIMTLLFSGWCIWVYPLGDDLSRGHLTFFLALTQVSSVFCLMSMRGAALRVAFASTLIFVLYFSWMDGGRMIIESSVLCFVCWGMIVVTHRYNLDFADLISSQRDLRLRQIQTERLSEENRRVSLTDALSGLPNRRQLLVRLDELEKQADLEPDSLAVIFIDLDGFKAINDSHGHHVGDSLLSSLSQRLRAACPINTMLARVGGDEFVLLIEAHGATAEALTLAERINREILLPVLVDNHVVHVGASVGVAGNAEGLLSAHELLRRADTAMYHVKVGGKGEIAVYDFTFDQGRQRRLVIENEIGEGLAKKEFDVFYQPIVEAQSGLIVGAEALIRWPRRIEGGLSPDQFISIAEASGQIRPLGLFVLERACSDFKAYDDLKLSVNLSPAQFNDPGFETQVAAILSRTGFPPERLQFEITEGYLLANPERANKAINGFRALGMAIALDDFGTGFTSIHYLQSYGFTHIKIDKSLLVGLHSGSKASMLIAGTVFLANGLDMRIIAEGVETEEQAALLRAAGCHKLQGFLFGHAVPIADFEANYWAQKPQHHKCAALC